MERPADRCEDRRDAEPEHAARGEEESAEDLRKELGGGSAVVDPEAEVPDPEQDQRAREDLAFELQASRERDRSESEQEATDDPADEEEAHVDSWTSGLSFGSSSFSFSKRFAGSGIPTM